MKLDQPPLFALTRSDGNHLTLSSPEGHVAHIFVLEEDLVRVMVLPKGELRAPKSWAICPGGEDVPSEGRDRFDLSGFSLPAFLTDKSASELIVTTRQIRLTIALKGFFCRWEVLQGGVWRPAAADRPTQAYNFGWWDQGVYHYLARPADEMYFGLGEKAGPANRAGQTYRMTNLDAMGYDARSTDPLYKHTPFYITWKQKEGLPFGLFYDTLSDCRFDMGRELDNYHGHYRSFRAEAGDLDLYFIAGSTPADITRRFTWLTGRPAMMPKWSLGYSGSTMSYTDAPDAQAQMNKFLEKCREHDILCDSFHLSSGYTSIGPKRYVFHWNRVKFPDPAGFARHYREHGVRLCANIKPCLLRDHPRYEEAAKAGLFIMDEDGVPVPAQFWDETGAYLDFTNPKTRAWWRARVTDALLETGIEATWNDNNEFEIWNDQAVLASGGRAADCRPLHTLLMIQASKQAQRDFAPDRRPFLISRAGAVGMQRYVQSWSGDNYTSWDTLKFNIRMGTGMAMSGLSNSGHDIGGFAGPAPDAELLLRWVQFGIFLPRFSIHSWNDDQTVNEPWMYPEITKMISALIKLRARLVPYLYDLLWRSHSAYEPMIRPTYYDFPGDPACFAENDEMMLGANLLVAAVVEPGQKERRVTLPRGTGWYDFWRGTRHEGGQTVSVPAGLDAQTPLFVREGSAIPLNLAEQHFNRPADQRGFAIFAGEGSFEASCHEDDGESDAYRDQWRLSVSADAKTLHIAIEKPKGATSLILLLPASEKRAVSLPATETAWEGWRRLDLTL
ncbi:MAG TPA: glycoside hydrolase family 31 protein [Magnetospirillaceae bacterium]|nr:glycoside hydrolase family 31 protein [Magnetospirillaceae bacterium]